MSLDWLLKKGSQNGTRAAHKHIGRVVQHALGRVSVCSFFPEMCNSKQTEVTLPLPLAGSINTDTQAKSWAKKCTAND